MGRSLAEMIKLVYCITRRRDLSLEEFSRYWHDVHGRIGRQIPGLRRLVQSHPLVASGQRMDFDGLAELWFDDLDALRAAQTSAEWQASSADEANFIDAARTALYRRIDERVYGAAPWLYLWFPTDLWARRPELLGWDLPVIFNGQRWTHARVAPR